MFRRQLIAPERVRSLWIGERLYTFAIRHVNPPLGRIEPYRGRIPSDGNETEWLGLARLGHVKDGQVVGDGIGNKHELPIGRQTVAVGRVARRGSRIETAGNRF